jgi:hypothetical protein
VKIWNYRLYVGADKLEDPRHFLYRRAVDMVARALPAATVYKAKGLWDHKWEHVYIIELITTEVEDRDVMTLLGKDLANLLREDSVLFTGHELSDFEIVINAKALTDRSNPDSTGYSFESSRVV